MRERWVVEVLRFQYAIEVRGRGGFFLELTRWRGPGQTWSVEACNATNGRDLIKRNGYIFGIQVRKW